MEFLSSSFSFSLLPSLLLSLPLHVHRRALHLLSLSVSVRGITVKLIQQTKPIMALKSGHQHHSPVMQGTQRSWLKHIYEVSTTLADHWGWIIGSNVELNVKRSYPMKQLCYLSLLVFCLLVIFLFLHLHFLMKPCWCTFSWTAQLLIFTTLKRHLIDHHIG